MPPALDAPVMDFKPRAGLTAARADAPTAAQPDGQRSPLAAEADVNDRCPEIPSSRLVVRASSSCVSGLPSTASSLQGWTAARRQKPRNIHSAR